MSTSASTSTYSGRHLTVSVPSQQRDYDIHIGPETLAMLPNWLESQNPKPKKVAVISDTNVGPIYAESMVQALQGKGFDVSHYDLTGGELSKSMKSAQIIYDILIAARFSRHDVLVAIGGGVIGDLVGFCAATYQRGMRWVQVPTSLLAQVDSSVGGKVAINFGGLKNVIGAFYQPNLVISDLGVLATLSERDYRAGLGEVVKYALLEQNALDGKPAPDRSLFDYLFTHADAIVHKDPAVLTHIVHYCCSLKAAVVAADETDTTGHRAILNLGHTFGHAYESISDYAILHGESVSLGVRKACELSVRLNLWQKEKADAVLSLMQRLNLMIDPPLQYESGRFIDWMRQDKKNHDSKITLILPTDNIGRVEVRRDINEADILQVL